MTNEEVIKTMEGYGWTKKVDPITLQVVPLTWINANDSTDSVSTATLNPNGTWDINLYCIHRLAHGPWWELTDGRDWGKEN